MVNVMHFFYIFHKVLFYAFLTIFHKVFLIQILIPFQYILILGSLYGNNRVDIYQECSEPAAIHPKVEWILKFKE